MKTLLLLLIHFYRRVLSPFKKAMLPLLSDLQCLCVAGGQTVWGMAWNGSGSSPDSAV